MPKTPEVQIAAQSASLLTFTVASTLIIVTAVVSSVWWLPISYFANEIPGGSKDGAKEALSLLKDSTVWMASIQTATIAALGLLAKDGAPSLKLSTLQLRLLILTATLNTLALFFSAWILTSLPSIMLRVHSGTATGFDFFNFTLYNYMGSYPILKALTVHFFAFWNHWLWGVGILLFGWLSVSMAVRRK